MTHPTDALRLVPLEPTWDQLVAMRDCCAELSGVKADSETMLTTLYRAALAAAPASLLPEGGLLWMMHVRGPDDIYPAPDYETAVSWCDYVNDVLAKAALEVMTKAVPAIWTLSPQEHAAYLPEAIKGWTLPAAPTGAK